MRRGAISIYVSSVKETFFCGKSTMTQPIKAQPDFGAWPKTRMRAAPTSSAVFDHLSTMSAFSNNLLFLPESPVEFSETRPSEQGSDVANTSKKKRKKVAKSCVSCRASHLACDEERPCRRCVRRGEECIDAERTPGLKRRRRRPKSEAPSTPALDTAEKSSLKEVEEEHDFFQHYFANHELPMDDHLSYFESLSAAPSLNDVPNCFSKVPQETVSHMMMDMEELFPSSKSNLFNERSILSSKCLLRSRSYCLWRLFI